MFLIICLGVHFVVLLEVCDILGVGKIFFSCICARPKLALTIDLMERAERLTLIVKLFKVMDLVLILVITMVSRSGLKHVSH